MSKKTVVFTFIFMLLILDFTALDDITTGNEPSFVGEYLTLFLTFPIFGYMLGMFWLFLAHKFKKSITQFTRFKGYHLHHSTLGILMIISALFLYPPWFGVVVAGLGVGIFIHHTATEGLVFITKD